VEVLAASGNPLTTAAAIRTLCKGGNAIDAGVAAGLAAAVVEPMASYSLASEVAALIYDAKKREVVALNGQGSAPKKATVDYFRSLGKSLIPVGPGHEAPLAFTVPGAVAAWILALDRYGTLSLGEVLEPAINYADRGFPIYSDMTQKLDLKGVRRQITEFFPQGGKYFFPGGRVPQPGERFIQKDLANVLKTLVEAEAKVTPKGRSLALRAAADEFYKGKIAAAIVRFSDEVGGLLSFEDFTEYQSKTEAPAKAIYKDIEIFGHQTWSQSATLLQALNILDGFELRKIEHNSPLYIHLIVETLKLVMADREKYYGDPEFVRVPLDELLSKEYAAERRKLIDPNKAHPGMPPFGDPIAIKAVGGMLDVVPNETPSGIDDSGTTHFSIVDKEGNVFIATPSGGKLDSGVVVPGLGFALSHRSEIFSLDPSHPNALEPGKRPRTTLVCYLACKRGAPWMTFGTPGGDNQTQADLQFFLNVVEFGMNPQEAVSAPRFSSNSFPGSFYPHGYFPGKLNLEAGFAAHISDALSLKGHRVTRVDHVGQGAIVVQLDRESGVRSAGTDPRRPTCAFAW
jgi:gamma-glutamyltranspeptidase/glutathione hydrolase